MTPKPTFTEAVCLNMLFLMQQYCPKILHDDSRRVCWAVLTFIGVEIHKTSMSRGAQLSFQIFLLAEHREIKNSFFKTILAISCVFLQYLSTNPCAIERNKSEGVN